MDEPVTLKSSSSCDVKTYPDNENTVKAQSKEMGHIAKGCSLNPFQGCPPPWFMKTDVNRISSKIQSIFGLI